MPPIPKPVRYQSEAYRRYVAEHPCMRCGVENYSQACHPNGAGAGTKASDRLCFPLCCARPGIAGCHYLHDQCIGITREDRKRLEDWYSATMQATARADGRPEFNKEAAC